MIKKYGAGVVAILLAITFAAFTTPNVKADSPKTNYYFKYLGSPGGEQNKASWQNVTSGFPSCGKVNDGCLIQVPDNYTTLSGGLRVLTQNVPVVISGSHKNPDTSNPMIVSASNLNP